MVVNALIMCKAVFSASRGQQIVWPSKPRDALDRADHIGYPASKALFEDRGIKYPDDSAKVVIRTLLVLTTIRRIVSALI
jgi:hypothetical protein